MLSGQCFVLSPTASVGSASIGDAIRHQAGIVSGNGVCRQVQLPPGQFSCRRRLRRFPARCRAPLPLRLQCPVSLRAESRALRRFLRRRSPLAEACASPVGSRASARPPSPACVVTVFGDASSSGLRPPCPVRVAVRTAGASSSGYAAGFVRASCPPFGEARTASSRLGAGFPVLSARPPRSGRRASGPSPFLRSMTDLLRRASVPWHPSSV